MLKRDVPERKFVAVDINPKCVNIYFTFPYFKSMFHLSSTTQRHCRRSSKIQKSGTLKSLCITKDFLNETYVTEDIQFNNIEDWEDFFLSGLKRNVIAMVTKPPKVYSDSKAVKDEELVHILPNVNFKKTNLEGMIYWFYMIKWRMINGATFL